MDEINIGDLVDIDSGESHFSGMVVVNKPPHSPVWIVKDDYKLIYIDRYNHITKHIKEPDLPF